MIYKKVEIGPDGRVLACLGCGSEQHFNQGNYCTICGKPIINFCACLKRSNFDSRFEPCSEAAGIPLPGNARFCPFCGSQTVFNLEGLLKPWQEEAEETKGPR